MANVQMQAVDSVHISSVQAEPLAAGARFEVGATEADELEKRGLAVRIASKSPKAK